MAGFGTGERFKDSKMATPGPGAYDPKKNIGFKADPTSGFQGNERFKDDPKVGGFNSSTDMSPMRERRPTHSRDGRSFAWSNQRLAELEHEVETLKARLKEKDKLLQQQANLLSEQDQLQKALQEMEAKAGHATGNSLADIEQLKSQLMIAKDKQLKNKKELMDAETRFARKDKEVKILEGQLIKFKEEMTNHTDRMQVVGAELDSLQTQLKDSQNLNCEHEEKIGTMEGELDELKRVLADKESQMEINRSEAEERLKDLKSSHAEDVNSMNMQIEAARQEVSLRAGTIEDLEKRMDRLKERLDSSREAETKWQTASKALEEENAQKQAEITSMKAELVEAESQIGSKNKTLEAVQKENDRLQNLVEAAEEASLAATEKSMDMEMELTAKFNEVAALKEACAKLKEVIKTKDAHIEEINQQKSNAEDAASAASSRADELEKQVNLLNEQLAESHQANRAQQESLHATEVELEDVKRALSQSDEQSRLLSGVCENHKADIAHLQSQVQDSHEELTRRKAEFEQSIVALNLTISNEQEKIGALEKEVEEKATAVALIESNLANSKLDIDEKVRQLADLEAANAEIREQAVKVEANLTGQMKELQAKHELQIEGYNVESAKSNALRDEMGTLEQSVQEYKAREEDLQAQLAAVLESQDSKTIEEVEKLQKELIEVKSLLSEAESANAKYKSELKKAEVVKAEMNRLMEENEVLAQRTFELDADVKGLLTSNNSVLGHHNPKQKIQYHLKLKQDFEELKRECTNLLKEKFYLEQCIRYLSSVGALETMQSVPGEPLRNNQIYVPASLAGSVMTLTPTSKNQLKWAGRGTAAKKTNLSPYKPREDMEQTIEQVKKETIEEVEGFIKSAQDCPLPSDDNRPAPQDGNLSPAGPDGPCPPETSMGRAVSPMVSPRPDSVESKIQARILAKINSVLERRPKRKADTQQENAPEKSGF